MKATYLLFNAIDQCAGHADHPVTTRTAIPFAGVSIVESKVSNVHGCLLVTKDKRSWRTNAVELVVAEDAIRAMNQISLQKQHA